MRAGRWQCLRRIIIVSPSTSTRTSRNMKKRGHVRSDDEVTELIGRRVGNFVISRVLGQGGMGAVFEAEHPTLGKQVAVKFLSRSLASTADMASRFLGEARTAASL